MKLTAENVHAVIRDSLFKEGEDASSAVMGEGVLAKMGFHPDRLKAHAEDIRTMLADLSDEFHADKGGGWSFLNACMTRDGEQWAEHPTIDQLLVLGIAIGRAKILFPRPMWSALPGGMPYFQVTVTP